MLIRPPPNLQLTDHGCSTCREVIRVVASDFISAQFLKLDRPSSPNLIMNANIDSWTSSCSVIDIFLRHISMASNPFHRVLAESCTLAQDIFE